MGLISPIGPIGHIRPISISRTLLGSSRSLQLEAGHLFRVSHEEFVV